MANQKHLRILQKGVDLWNHWRKKNRDVKPDLSRADLRKTNLRGAYLSGADLSGADLELADLNSASLIASVLDSANLSEVRLPWANLQRASAHRATFRRAYAIEVDFVWTNLQEADFHEAELSGADFRLANLTGANFISTRLESANLSQTDLHGANFSNCSMRSTSLEDVDLQGVKGLDAVRHFGPSHIGIDTIYRSKGNIPEVFLKGVGVPENFVNYMRSLVGNAFDFYSCFISYSGKDEEFAKRLHTDLQSKGVRCWFAPKDLKIGDKLRPSFDEAIRLYDKLMVVLSKSSVKSAWVEKEVETAFEKEKKQGRTVLFPIRLDDVVMDTDQAWAADIRRTRHIGDFSDWKNHDSYKKAFERLLRDLRPGKRDEPSNRE